MPTRTSYSPMPQLAQQLDPPEGVDLGVEVAGADAGVEEVVGEVLGHLLGQRRDQDPLVLVGPGADLVDQVVDLALGRLDDDLGVDQPGRPDDLLDHVGLAAADLVELVVARGRGEVDGLADPVEELLPPQRPVVHRARQPEAVVDEVALARHVAFVHAADLRHRDVRLVDDEQEVLGEVVEQAVGRGAAGAAVDVHRVVLDAGAGADLAHHLDVVRRAHPQPLRLEQLALPLERRELVVELELDALDRPLHALRAGDVVGGREDVELGVLGDHLAGDRVQRHQPLDLVAEELDRGPRAPRRPGRSRGCRRGPGTCRG